MKTVDMYEMGEEVLIRANVTDILVDQGKIKYKLRVEHTSTDLDHTFSESQLIPVFKEITEEDECSFEDVDDGK